ncbi:MAG: hypothetical protein ACRCUY_11835 [Thermoguttaceae bacterium]
MENLQEILKDYIRTAKREVRRSERAHRRWQADWEERQRLRDLENEKRREEEQKRREEEQKRREEEQKRREEERLKYEEDRKKWEEESRKSAARMERAVERAANSVDGKWGQLVEALAQNQVVPLLQRRGINIERLANHSRKGSHEGQNFEFDIVAINGDTIVIIEVKTTLQPKHIKHFLKKLAHAKKWMPEYRHHKVLGGVAFLREGGNASQMAENNGLFTILATGSSAKITNHENFIPKEF